MRRVREIWQLLAQIMGEGTYDRYCEHLRRKHPERKIPTAHEFYYALLDERYSRPSRCC
jgi:uncharacterized short protein YbdD (DUF466 family)